MRFRLTLTPIQDRQRLLFNYQYPLQAWIYGRLANADAAYASFLHERGYVVPESKKVFKHFTFSSLQIPRTEPVKKGDTYMTLRSGSITLLISFYLDKAAEDFIIGLFQQQQLSIYNRECRADFVVERVETMALPPMQTTMHFSTLSQMVVAQKREGVDQYLSPTDDEFGRFFALNLWDKYRSIAPDKGLMLDEKAVEKLIRFELVSPPERIKMRGAWAKESNDKQRTKVIGYHNFTFALTAPPELIEVGYWGGFGKYSSMGFGCVEVS